jgi:alpha-beta hydrolase superfamily lysophospholipase
MGLAGARRAAIVLMTACSVAAQPPCAVAQSHSVSDARETIVIRGREQALHLYGNRGGVPVVVSSGDGGWIHLAPHVAETLAANGFFVVGVDTRAYLESFTHGTQRLRVEEAPGDYRSLVDVARRGSTRRPVLLGVSEGAGLSVLAAADARVRPSVAGVVAVGLSDLTELGWRWRDMVIYFTHGVPKEPTFSVSAMISRLSPVPLAAIHSRRDEYVPAQELQQVMEKAGEPKRLWVIDAGNHRFSDKLAEFDRALIEALKWIDNARPEVAP